MNSDWLELVIYFHTKEQDGGQNAVMVNFSDNRRGFKASLRRRLLRKTFKKTCRKRKICFSKVKRSPSQQLAMENLQYVKERQ